MNERRDEMTGLDETEVCDDAGDRAACGGCMPCRAVCDGVDCAGDCDYCEPCRGCDGQVPRNPCPCPEHPGYCDNMLIEGFFRDVELADLRAVESGEAEAENDASLRELEEEDATAPTGTVGAWGCEEPPDDHEESTPYGSYEYAPGDPEHDEWMRLRDARCAKCPAFQSDPLRRDCRECGEAYSGPLYDHGHGLRPPLPIELDGFPEYPEGDGV